MDISIIDFADVEGLLAIGGGMEKYRGRMHMPMIFFHMEANVKKISFIVPEVIYVYGTKAAVILF